MDGGREGAGRIKTILISIARMFVVNMIGKTGLEKIYTENALP